jgi:hypothetical protein
MVERTSLKANQQSLLDYVRLSNKRDVIVTGLRRQWLI